jgi:thioredoxin 1
MAYTILRANDFEREVLQADKPVMVDFVAPGCSECRRLEPVVHQMSHVFQDRVKITLLNVADAPDIAEEYKIMASPTLVFFKNGQAVDTLFGYQDAAHLEAHLERVLLA